VTKKRRERSNQSSTIITERAAGKPFVGFSTSLRLHRLHRDTRQFDVCSPPPPPPPPAPATAAMAKTKTMTKPREPKIKTKTKAKTKAKKKKKSPMQPHHPPTIRIQL